MLQLPSASSYNHLKKIMNEVGSPTEDFHLISSRPCWAYTNSSSGQFKAALVFKGHLLSNFSMLPELVKQLPVSAEFGVMLINITLRNGLLIG